MNSKSLSGRGLKRWVQELLKSSDFEKAMEKLSQLPSRQVINPLFSFLHHSDPEIKWAAIKAMGAIVANLANEDMEEARVIMRRLMWNLNDESGGIGWGTPEAMGEILACHKELAEEYAHVLISYTREDGNYLEHEMLQRGLLWGIGRLAQVRAHLLKDAVPYLMPYLDSSDAPVRGLATWTMGLLGVKEACPKIKRLTEDDRSLDIYMGGQLTNSRVMDLAAEALKTLQCKDDDP